MSARTPTLTEAGAAGPWSPATAPRSDLGPWLRAQARLLRANPDLLVVALLFLLMACGSRSFAKTIHIGPLYVTEMLIGLAGILAIVRLGLRRSWEALRRLPLIPLALIWLLGAIATARGVADFGFSMVKNDIGLVDYTLILPLLALVLTDRKRFEAMFSVLVACASSRSSPTVLFTVDQLAGTADTMLDAIPVAYGLYITRRRLDRGASDNCLPTPRWLTLFVPPGWC